MPKCCLGRSSKARGPGGRVYLEGMTGWDARPQEEGGGAEAAQHFLACVVQAVRVEVRAVGREIADEIRSELRRPTARETLVGRQHIVAAKGPLLLPEPDEVTMMDVDGVDHLPRILPHTCQHRQKDCAAWGGPIHSISEASPRSGSASAFSRPSSGVPKVAFPDVPTTLASGRRSSLPHCAAGMVNPSSVRRKASVLGATNMRQGPRRAVLVSSSELPAPITQDSRWLRAKRCLERAFASIWTDVVVSVVLLIEAVVVGVQADYCASQLDSAVMVPPALHAVEIISCVFFTVEWAARLYDHIWVGLRPRSIPWLIFDGATVALQLADEIVQAAFSGEGAQAVYNVGALRVVRVLRLFRILRLLRVAGFVGELRKVVYLIIGSLWAFVWTAMLLLLLIYVLAVFFTQVLSGHGNVQLEDPLRHHFSSTLTSVYTLYKSIAGGLNWEDVSDPLSERSPLLGLVFGLYVGFALMVLLNLVTGVFIESALRISQADKEADLLQKLRRVFAVADMDNSGSISLEEFRANLYSEPMLEFFEALEIGPARAEELFNLLDESQDQMLSPEELVVGSLMLQGPAKAMDFVALSKSLHEAVEELTVQVRHVRQHLDPGLGVGGSAERDSSRAAWSGVSTHI